MADITTGTKPAPDAEVTSRVLLDRAKRLWAYSLACKLAAPVIGTVSVLSSLFPEAAPWAVACLAGASEIVLWRSDVYRGAADKLRRKLDFRDSFGWRVPYEDYRDLFVQYPFLADTVARHPVTPPYFDSPEPVGVQRALHNLAQSAWYSKHLSYAMFKWCAGIVVVLFLSAMAVLAVSLTNLPVRVMATGLTSWETSIGRVVTAALTLIFSLGLLRLGVAYYGYSDKAEATYKSANALRRVGDADQVQAVRLFGEYHIARASAPVLPTWLWRRMEPRLNREWQREDQG